MFIYIRLIQVLSVEKKKTFTVYNYMPKIYSKNVSNILKTRKNDFVQLKGNRNLGTKI